MYNWKKQEGRSREFSVKRLTQLANTLINADLLITLVQN
jgi:hypothetical protein